MLQSSSLKFFKSLAKNNNKPWFDEHRNEYIEAKNDFENFVSALIKKTSEFDENIKDLQVKDCTFRLNRDIRFSKDKTPYKINMGASLNRGGKKSVYAGYYFHFEPGGKSFAGGGLWMPAAIELKKIRQEIDYSYDELNGLLKSKDFVSQYKELQSTADVKLTNLPRGYDKANPAAEFLKLKSILAIRSFSDTYLLRPDLINIAATAFKALMPLIKFLNRAIE